MVDLPESTWPMTTMLMCVFSLPILPGVWGQLHNLGCSGLGWGLLSSDSVGWGWGTGDGESQRATPQDIALHRSTSHLCSQTGPPRPSQVPRFGGEGRAPSQPVPDSAEPGGKPKAQTVQSAVDIWVSCSRSPHMKEFNPHLERLRNTRLDEPHDQSGAR